MTLDHDELTDELINLLNNHNVEGEDELLLDLLRLLDKVYEQGYEEGKLNG